MAPFSIDLLSTSFQECFMSIKQSISQHLKCLQMNDTAKFDPKLIHLFF